MRHRHGHLFRGAVHGLQQALGLFQLVREPAHSVRRSRRAWVRLGASRGAAGALDCDGRRRCARCSCGRMRPQDVLHVPTIRTCPALLSPPPRPRHQAPEPKPQRAAAACVHSFAPAPTQKGGSLRTGLSGWPVRVPRPLGMPSSHTRCSPAPWAAQCTQQGRGWQCRGWQCLERRQHASMFRRRRPHPGQATLHAPGLQGLKAQPSMHWLLRVQGRAFLIGRPKRALAAEQCRRRRVAP